MRFALFDDGRLGFVDGDDLLDVTDALGDDARHCGGALQAWIEAHAAGRAPSLSLEAAPRVPLATARLQAPLPRPGKIIGAPVNYRDHQSEMEYTTSIADLGVFLKANSSVIGPGQDIRLPYSDKRTDQEGELGVVIGRTASHVPVEKALSYVFGYTCVLDITVRSGEDRSTRKSFDTFTPLDPPAGQHRRPHLQHQRTDRLHQLGHDLVPRRRHRHRHPSRRRAALPRRQGRRRDRPDRPTGGGSRRRLRYSLRPAARQRVRTRPLIPTCRSGHYTSHLRQVPPPGRHRSGRGLGNAWFRHSNLTPTSGI
jgi:2-keto-4-pentenoate hydratase/2-oxohepta-3-ene-1,7-dioic acid hydratase in catechol pathway